MSVFIVACPHCYSDVLPMADGRCPSCMADTTSAAAERAPYTKVTLENRAADLPPVCIACGASTERTTRFRQKAKNERYAVGTSGGGAIGLLISWIIDRVSGKSHDEVCLQVPHCPGCARQKRDLRVKHVDFDERRVTFIAHRAFSEALGGAK